MSDFREVNRYERLLLPPSIDEFISDNHPARMIDEVVENFDTREIENKYSWLGRKAFHPKVMIKLLFYGYTTGVRSSRKLAKRCEEDLAFMFLCCKETPDFRTINDFRKDHLEELKEYFKDIVLLGRQLGLGLSKAIFIDGTKIRANASAKKSKKEEKLDELIRELDDAIEEAFKEADEIDRLEDEKYGDSSGNELPPHLRKKADRKRALEEARRSLKEKGLMKINLTDEDANMMKISPGVIRPGYNCQAVVTEDDFIVAQDCVTDSNDSEQLEPMVEQAKEMIPKVTQVVGDAGYGTYDALEYLKKQGLDGYVRDFNGDIRRFLKGDLEKLRYHWLSFTYDKERKSFICPEGKELPFFGIKNYRGREHELYKGTECPSCLVREQCTKRENREVVLDSRWPLVVEMLEKFKSEEGRELYKKRMHACESPFGNIKMNLGYTRFLLRGKIKVQGEYGLMCVGHDFGKIYRALKLKARETGKGFRELIREIVGKFKQIKEAGGFFPGVFSAVSA